MKDQSQSEEMALAFEEYERLDEMEGTRELFQEAGDGVEMREQDGMG